MTEALFLKPKMGLVPEISMQNYDTIAKQLREMVSNSLDANAKSVHITILRSGNDVNLIVEDNGHGMDKHDLKERFLGLGGSEKYFDKTKIGRIGIGFLAAVPLCEAIEIRTRKKGNKVIVATLDSNKLTLEELRTKKIEEIQIGEINEEISNADELGYAPHFTKISLLKIKPFVLETFKDNKKLETLKEELQKILPLKYDPKSELFNYISPSLKKDLLENSEDYSIDVYLNSKEPLKRKVYGDEGEVIYAIKEFREVKVDNMRVVGYFIRKDQPENRKIRELKNWDGLVVRVQNVAVIESGFLGLPGHDERKKRICGEIFILGIDKNKAITIDRNNFNEADPQYLIIKNFIHEQLSEFIDGVNYDWNLKSDLNKTLGAAAKLDKVMEKASKGISKLKQTKLIKTPEKNLSEYKKTKLVDLSALKNKYQDIKVTTDKDVSSKKSYKIVWDDIAKRKGEVKIDAAIYNKDKWEFQIESKTYLCQFVDGHDNGKPCDLDSKNNIFYINRNNLIIKSLKPDYIILCILVEYSRATSKTKEDMSEKLFGLMQGLIQ